MTRNGLVKNVVASGHNELLRPPVAKALLHFVYVYKMVYINVPSAASRSLRQSSIDNCHN